MRWQEILGRRLQESFISSIRKIILSNYDDRNKKNVNHDFTIFRIVKPCKAKYLPKTKFLFFFPSFVSFIKQLKLSFKFHAWINYSNEKRFHLSMSRVKQCWIPLFFIFYAGRRFFKSDEIKKSFCCLVTLTHDPLHFPQTFPFFGSKSRHVFDVKSK